MKPGEEITIKVMRRDDGSFYITSPDVPLFSVPSKYFVDGMRDAAIILADIIRENGLTK